MPKFRPVQFGKYYLLDRIATGGMAEVFKAKITGDHGFEKIVIIKTLFPHLQTEKELVTSFIEEAKLAALLHHQNIVQIYDFGKVDESYFIAMEYLSGINLRQILDVAGQIPLSMANALFICQKICAGLDYAHNTKDLDGKPLNLIHRDVSPPNIIITNEGTAKIIDFGIAKAASQNTSTRMGIIKGKVAYMSPEQAEGKIIDHRSDIFSIGILLYEMVSNHQMYKGDTVDVLDLAKNAEFEPIKKIKPDLPEQIQSIINKALKKNIAQRYQSADEMMHDIEKCIIDLALRPTGHELALFLKQIAEKDSLKEEDEEFRETIIIDTSDNQTPPPKKKLIVCLIIMTALFGFAAFPTILNKNYTFNLTSILKKTLPEKPESIQHKIVTPQTDAQFDPKAKADAIKALKEKHFHDAVIQFENLLAKYPEMADSLKQPYTEALLGEALQFTEQDTDKVTESYQKIITLDNEFVDAFFNLGYVYAINKNYKNAEIMYQHTVDLKPPYLDEALFNLASVQDKLGKNEMAAKNLKKAYSINPKNTMVKKYLKKMQKSSGRK